MLEYLFKIMLANYQVKAHRTIIKEEWSKLQIYMTILFSMMIGVAASTLLKTSTHGREDEERDRPKKTRIDLDQELDWHERFEKDNNGNWKKRDE